MNNPTTLVDPWGLQGQGPQGPCANLPYGRGGGMCQTEVNSVIAAEQSFGPGSWDPYDLWDLGFWSGPGMAEGTQIENAFLVLAGLLASPGPCYYVLANPCGGQSPPSPTNVSAQQQQERQGCLSEYNNSVAGNAIQFFSLYNLATNFSGAWKDWVVWPAAKIGAASLTKWASQVFGNTEFWSITSPAAAPAEQIIAPAAAGIQWAEGVGGAAAPVAIIGATAADMTIQSACAGNQPQSELAPTVF